VINNDYIEFCFAAGSEKIIFLLFFVVSGGLGGVSLRKSCKHIYAVSTVILLLLSQLCWLYTISTRLFFVNEERGERDFEFYGLNVVSVAESSWKNFGDSVVNVLKEFRSLFSGGLNRSRGLASVESGLRLVSNMDDWNVTGSEIKRDEVVVLNGDLFVFPDGNLTFLNVVLYVNCSFYGEFGIRVLSGGVFNLFNSVIASYNPKYGFYFYVDDDGFLRMVGSELRGCGYEWSPGLCITGEAEIVDSTIRDGGVGIFLNGSSDVSFINCTISGNDRGIHCINSSATIRYCNIVNNSEGVFCVSSNLLIEFCNVSLNLVGIFSLDCYDVKIENCSISKNLDHGVYCSNSNVSIVNCVIGGNGFTGVVFESCSGCLLVNNVFIGDGLVIWANSLRFFVHEIRGNFVTGKPLLYVLNESDVEISGEYGQIIIVNSTRIKINGVNISKTDVAIEIAFSNDVQVRNCNIASNDYGIYCISSNVTVQDCNLTDNCHGLECDNSNVIVENCNILYNFDGIFCIASNLTVKYCNIFGNSEYGVYNYYGPSKINATLNWWGSSDGPEFDLLCGDSFDPEEVNYDVVYEPWLKKPATIIKVLPSVKILFPLSEAILWPGRVPMKWVVETGRYNVVKVEIRLDKKALYWYEVRKSSGKWIDVTNRTSYTFENLKEGIYVVTIRVVDEAGNVVKALVRFRVKFPLNLLTLLDIIVLSIVSALILFIVAGMTAKGKGKEIWNHDS